MTKRILLAFSAVSLFTFAACGSGSKSTADMKSSADMKSAPDMATFQSDCGKPGDVGNALGVGKFCMTISDCSDTAKAHLCSILGNDDETHTYFCTTSCTKDGPSDQCGDGATCQCQGNQCGCTPNECLGEPEDGGVSEDAGVSDGGTTGDASTTEDGGATEDAST